MDDCTNIFLNKLTTNNDNNSVNKHVIKLYYENQMNPNYKKEEKFIQNIAKGNVKTTDINSKLTLIIYYCNAKVINLIMVNNLTKKYR